MSTNHNRIKVADLETNQSGKILSTNSSGELEFTNITSVLDFKTINGESILGSGNIVTTSIEPSQIIITTTTNITTDTLDVNSKKQIGKNVIINNGTSAISITVNGGNDFCASYLKHGSATITFVQAAGRTLVAVNSTVALNGSPGSTATISSIGTTDYLRISNV